MSELTLGLRANRSVVSAESPEKTVVEVTITAPREPVSTNRQPLNLALALDRSGSMGGDKLENAKRAVTAALNTLEERDGVALVIYDHEIEALSRSGPADAERKAQIERLLRQIHARGSTNLCGGYLRGAQEASGGAREGVISRVLLLSDGLANVGETNLDAIIEHARELRIRGISTSTLGVGADFDEDLLRGMAEAGGGHYFFAQGARDIPRFLQQEFGELVTVVAREASLTLRSFRGADLELLGDLQSENREGAVYASLGDISSGETCRLYLAVTLPPSAPADTLPVMAELTYAGAGARSNRASAEIEFRYAAAIEAAETAVDQDIEREANGIRAAAAKLRALWLDREGNRDQARAVLYDCLAAAAPMMMAEDAQALRDIAADLEGAAPVDPIARKMHVMSSYARRMGR